MSNPNHSPELTIAIEAAKIGAEKALHYFVFETDLKQFAKSDNSLLTITNPAREVIDIVNK